MSDEQMDTATGTPGTPVVEETMPKQGGLLSTPMARIIMVVAGLSVLAIIGGVAAAIIFGSSIISDSGVQEPGSGDVTPAEAADSVTDSVIAAGPAIEVRNSEVFTFRDIFDPLLKPLPEPTMSTDGTTTSPTTPSTTDTATPYAQGVLYLDGVETVDGVMKAVLRYNGQTYTLAPGEGIPGTPWEVFSVSSGSVTMLYGDNRITLVVGQGITK